MTHRTYSDPAVLVKQAEARKANPNNGWPIRRVGQQPSAKVVPLKRKTK